MPERSEVTNKIVMLPIMVQVQWQDGECVMRLPGWELPDVVLTSPSEQCAEVTVAARLIEIWQQVEGSAS